MKRIKFAQRTTSIDEVEPFYTAEEAWFWCWSCLIAREQGARFTAGLGLTSRPCDPDDLIITAGRLVADGKLTQRHAVILAEFGRKQISPDPGSRTESLAARFWEEALDLLLTVWRAKGIVQ